MIDFDKLDKISELPISEELLGAYLEGNLDLQEAAFVENMIDASPALSEFFDECALVADNSYSMPFDESILVDNINLAELDPIDSFTADDLPNNMDSQQEPDELKSSDDIEDSFYIDTSEEDGTHGSEGLERNAEGYELGFDAEPTIEEFATDLHEINEDVSNDLDFNAFFSDQG